MGFLPLEFSIISIIQWIPVKTQSHVSAHGVFGVCVKPIRLKVWMMKPLHRVLAEMKDFP
jgi:hypothetical protein